MGQPVVVNGITISMTNGSSSKSSAFSAGSPKVKMAGNPVVKINSLLGGLTFTSSLQTTKTHVDGVVIPLVGATVTDSAGYTGVIPPTCGAGAKFVAT